MGLIQWLFAQTEHDRDARMKPEDIGYACAISSAWEAVNERQPKEMIADYYFLAACYASAKGNERTSKKCMHKLRKYAPEYNPSVRFRPVNGTKLENPSSVLAIEQMNNLLRLQPDFSFERILCQYLTRNKVSVTR